jgi:SPP1 gp7 family putative phage head morphogenesis protein
MPREDNDKLSKAIDGQGFATTPGLPSSIGIPMNTDMFTEPGQSKDGNFDQQVAIREGFEPIDNPIGIPTVSTADWFGPLQPLRQNAPKGTEIRRFEYNIGQNLIFTPRANEAMGYGTLQALADSLDLLRIIIETAKNQMRRLKFGIHKQWDSTVKVKDRKVAEENDPVIKEVMQLLKRPDGRNPWSDFINQIFEDKFVIDAPCVAMRRDMFQKGPNGLGKVKQLIPISGKTITRYINTSGLTPMPNPQCQNPAHANLGKPQKVNDKGNFDEAQVCECAAYTQYLYGINATNLTVDDIVYYPYNTRCHKLYGYSEVEQIVVAINLALNREISLVQYFTDGNLPEAICALPNSMTPDDIREFEGWFNEVERGNRKGFKRRVKFVPTPTADGKLEFHETKSNLFDAGIDEWLARLIAYAFNLPPTSLVKMMNRASGQQQSEDSEVSGFEPYKLWFEEFMNMIIQVGMGYEDYYFQFDVPTETDLLKQRQADDIKVKSGGKTLNEWREDEGDEPYDPALYPDADKPIIVTATGYVVVGDQAAQQQAALDAQNNGNDDDDEDDNDGGSGVTGGNKPSGAVKSQSKKATTVGGLPIGNSEPAAQTTTTQPNAISWEGTHNGSTDLRAGLDQQEAMRIAGVIYHGIEEVFARNGAYGFGTERPGDKQEGVLRPLGGDERYQEFVSTGLTPNQLATTNKRAPNPVIMPGHFHPDAAAAKTRIEVAIGNTLKRIQEDVVAYLKKYAKSYRARVYKQDTDEPEQIMAQLDTMLKSDWMSLPLQVRMGLEESILAGVAQGVIDTGKMSSTLFNETNEIARDYAKTRAAEMVGMTYDASGQLVPNPDASMAISSTTRDAIKQAVTEAFEKNTPIDELAQKIQESGIFSDSRAQMIARTEVANAQVKGNFDTWMKSGVVDKVKWIVDGDPCDICIANDGEVRKIGEAFPSGDIMPTVHPNCACGLVAVLEPPTKTEKCVACESGECLEHTEPHLQKGFVPTVYTCRHGATDLDKPGDAEIVAGNTDIPLNDKGIENAKSVASKLKDAGITDIYTSTTPRAKQTAQIIGDALNVQVHDDPQFDAPDYPSLVGRTVGDTKQEYESFKQNPDKPMGKGSHETFADYYHRNQQGMTLVKIHARFGQVPLVVTHGKNQEFFDGGEAEKTGGITKAIYEDGDWKPANHA